MINILLSTYDFDNKFCFDKIKNIIQPNMKVLILPFAHDYSVFENEDFFNELYDFDYGKEFNNIYSSFYNYGIKKENVIVLNPFRDNEKFMKMKIQQADILFGVGGNPIIFMEMLNRLNILEDIKSFNRMFIGASASAMVQMKEFVTYPTESEDYDFEFYEGLGFIEDKDIIVHWDNKDYQFDAIIYSIIRRDMDFILLEDGKCKIIKKEE